ncbi:hypothetical protein M5K25_025222 [Dendrobium thyrsiflorum]|uniref:Aminotransferase-like plant mobile domain-containing protein n=1 Tax=Dendrobium thyrsiflorum TaxID=117978 RepID=A0ABD0U3T1_DENTH
MAGGGAKAEPEEELSSRSSSGGDSEKWETSEEGRTKSKGKLLPDGFLDPLPPQKSLKRPRFSGMVEDACKQGQRRVKRRDTLREDIMDPTASEVHPSIANLRGWNEERVREVPIGNVRMYRDEIDGLQQSQVIWEPYTPALMVWLPKICVDGMEIWQARVPLISWKRVEWHLPDRVMRQFGGRQSIELEPMERTFRRVDGRGRANVDWMEYHCNYIEMWNKRRAYIIVVTPRGDDQGDLLRYMHWYRSWASLYLLKAPIAPPNTYYPKSPVERIMMDYYVQSKCILRPFFGEKCNGARAMQLAIDEVASLCNRVESAIHIDFGAVKEPIRDNTHRGTSPSSVVGAGASRVIWEPYTPALMVWLPKICVDGMEIWQARVPLISWKRVEWHLPDRVMRQFGGRQSIELEPMERTFRRVDGRGRANVD